MSGEMWNDAIQCSSSAHVVLVRCFYGCPSASKDLKVRAWMARGDHAGASGSPVLQTKISDSPHLSTGLTAQRQLHISQDWT